MKFNYIDIHSHLNLSPLIENHGAILVKMRELGIGTITVGTGLETSRQAVKIADENPDICWATVGLHPCHACGGEAEEYDGEALKELVQHPRVVAIGETGLDYFHEDTPESRKIQEDVFKKHIALATKFDKPLMLHVRASKGSDDAYYDALKILLSDGYDGRANFHFFSGSLQCMQDIIAAGYTVSVDGPITFTNQYDDMIRACPIDKIMIETDAPFAAPAPYRGKPCEPWMVGEVAKKIADLKGLDLGVVQAQLLQNTAAFFGLDL